MHTKPRLWCWFKNGCFRTGTGELLERLRHARVSVREEAAALIDNVPVVKSEMKFEESGGCDGFRYP